MVEIATGLTISAIQAKMARVALGLGVRDVAELAQLSSNTIARLERGEDLKPATLAAIRGALESAGVIFVDENGEGPGVRLKKVRPAGTGAARQHIK